MEDFKSMKFILSGFALTSTHRDCKYKFAHGYVTTNREVIGRRREEQSKEGGQSGWNEGKEKGQRQEVRIVTPSK